MVPLYRLKITPKTIRYSAGKFAIETPAPPEPKRAPTRDELLERRRELEGELLARARHLTPKFGGAGIWACRSQDEIEADISAINDKLEIIK